MGHGFCVWLTGLSGAGKTTTARFLARRLEVLGRVVTLLDGDEVRTHLSRELGFSRSDRETHILRMAFVAREVVRHGGAVICSAISPYRSGREACRALVGPESFVEVHVDTPLEICEQRDVKGLYARARCGELTGLTGLGEPYEPPAAPAIRLETLTSTVEANVERLLTYLGPLFGWSDIPPLEFQISAALLAETNPRTNDQADATA